MNTPGLDPTNPCCCPVVNFVTTCSPLAKAGRAGIADEVQTLAQIDGVLNHSSPLLLQNHHCHQQPHRPPGSLDALFLPQSDLPQMLIIGKTQKQRGQVNVVGRLLFFLKRRKKPKRNAVILQGRTLSWSRDPRVPSAGPCDF